MAISDLTERQKRLLCDVVEEFIEEAEPIGSKRLVERCGLDISPATVRNEMARLIEEGLLDKPHASAGRFPTTMGFRFYINELMEENELPVIEEVSLKQRLWPHRFSAADLWYETANALADSTKGLSIVLAKERVFSSGAVNVLDHPEFFDIDVTKTALHLLDHPELLEELFDRAELSEGVHTLVGAELGLTHLEPCGLVFSPIELREGYGVVGVLGPNRMEYYKVIPRVRYVSGLLRELGKEW
ncbi:MAG: hypothetical protein ACOC6Q_00170 [Patescibacteria group bacterium]